MSSISIVSHSRRGVVALAIGALLAAACSGSGSETSDGSEVPATSTAQSTDRTEAQPTEPEAAGAATDEPTTPVPVIAPLPDPAAERIAATNFDDLLDDHGVLPIDVAVQILATVEPIEGIDAFDASVALPGEAPAMAVRRLGPIRDELAADVVVALDTFLAPSDDDVEVDVGPARAREVDASIGGGSGTEPTSAELAASVADIVAAFERLSGHTLEIPIRIRVIDRDTTAYAVGTGTGVTGCRIDYPRASFSYDSASATSTLAHEVWHCFQYDAGLSSTTPNWIAEGQAEWAGESYVGGSASSAPSWDRWLGETSRSLWRRSYDAMGVYSVAAKRGSDPWTVMLSMIGQSNAAAVSALFGSTPDDAVVAAAQNLVRAPEVGDPWESTGPGITDLRSAPVVSPTGGAPAEVSVAVSRFATLPAVLSIPADDDLITISIDGGIGGIVQLQGADEVRLGAGGHARFCLREGGCACPGDPTSGDDIPPAAPGEGAAAVGATDSSTLTIRAEFSSVDDECRDLVGVWTSDVSTQLASILSAFGGGGAPGCDGPFTLTFLPDGSFAVDSSLDCSTPEGSASGDVSFVGSYTADGDTFTLADITGSGALTLTIGGFSNSIDILEGFRQAGASPTPYTIVDDVLTYEFAGQSFSFSRSS